MPIGAGELPQAMGEWDKHLHAETPDALVQLAAIHHLTEGQELFK